MEIAIIAHDMKKELMAPKYDFKLVEAGKYDEWLKEDMEKYKNVFFFEESVEYGSIAEHFGKMLSESGYCGNYSIRCVSGFVPHMEVKNAMKLHGLDRESMINAIEEALK